MYNFYGPQGHSYDCFLIHSCETCVYALYMYFRKLHHFGEIGKIMGVAHNVTHALKVNRSAGRKQCSLRSLK